jgi:hypothetical protein
MTSDMQCMYTTVVRFFSLLNTFEISRRYIWTEVTQISFVLSNFALERAIRKQQEDNEGLEQNETLELLVCSVMLIYWMRT